MEFYDFAWSALHQLVGTEADNVRILIHDDLRFPYLGRDRYGYVLHLIKPRKLGRDHVMFQGMRLNLRIPFHKKVVWHLFKAATYHLALHAAFSDFSFYWKLPRTENLNVAAYAVSLVEDAALKSRLMKQHSALIPDIAFANAVSHFLLKPVSEMPNDASKIMTALLSKLNIGEIKGKLDGDMEKDVKEIEASLQNLDADAEKHVKLEAAHQIYEKITRYGEPFEVPSLLYTESHGRNTRFYEEKTLSWDKIKPVFIQALSTFQTGNEQLNAGVQNVEDGGEAFRALRTWEELEASKQKILAQYAAIGKGTLFEDFAFPIEDYAQYLRRRKMLGSSIRRIMHKLRLLKNVTGEDFRQESGFIDLQEAIQVIASKSQRTDIFVREELQTRQDTWSILIDASHSLSLFKGEVSGVALCLAEVAKTLILNQNSWGVYAFNNKFYIVKDFSETYTNRVRARIGGLTHGGLTYLPDAVKLASQALMKRLEEAKVLVIISDFFPSGYENIEDDLKETLKKIERMGIGVIGIGIRSKAVKKYLRASCVVRTPFELMKKFTKAFIEFSST